MNPLFLITGFAEEAEHVLLVDLDAGLIKRVDPIQIGRHGAGAAEEIHQFAHREGVHLVDA